MTSLLTPQGRAIDAAALRAAFRLRPEGVTILTTLDEFGNQWGMTATSVTSVSLDPPLLLVCAANRSGVLGPLMSGARFVVHFLAADQGELARHFATPMEDKFAGTRYEYAPSGCPKLNGALVSLECVTHAAHPAGDHTIVVGLVLDIVHGDRRDRALVSFDGALSSIGSDADPAPAPTETGAAR